MKKSLSSNALLNGIKTLVSIIYPLITLPYINKVLQVKNVGNYNYSYSIVTYFALIASLGISTYAIREGAKIRDDHCKINIFCSEIFSINIISTTIAYILLWILIFNEPKLKQYSSLVIVLSISILCSTIGCEWVFSIFEDYFYITIRSIIFQFLSLGLLFLLVKSQTDVLKYALVTVISSSGANIVNFIAKSKYVKITLQFNKRLLSHLKPILILFASNVATVIYVNSDVTMLGALVGTYSVGLYSVSTKVYSLVKQLLSAIIIVSIPRLSYYISNGLDENYKITGTRIFKTLFTLVMPCVVGIFALANKIVLILSDVTFASATNSLKIISFALIFCVFGWFYTSCVLIPNREENKVLIATVAAAAVNIGLNFILIPLFNQNAAALTTMIAEFCSFLIVYLLGRKYINIKFKYGEIFSVVLGCSAIIVICKAADKFINSLILNIVLSVLFSALCYVIILALFRNPILKGYIQDMKTKMRKQ